MISSLYKKHSITFFYLMLLLVFSHSFISAQTPDMPFNIYLKQASLKEFTAKIEQLSEYSFIYGEEVVLKHPITLDLKETPTTVQRNYPIGSVDLNRNHSSDVLV